MIEKMSQSAGNVLGYKITGKVKKEDYAELNADVEALLQENETIGILLDLEDMEGEDVKAWGADLKFGREYRKKIARMAIVGDKKWQKRMTALVDPLFAREAEFFPIDERDAAWQWLQT